MPKYKVGDKVYSFPEGTPQAEIDAALEDMSSPQAARPSKFRQLMESLDKNVDQNPAVQAGNAEFGLPPTMATGLPPMNPIRNLMGMLGGGLSAARKGNMAGVPVGVASGYAGNNDPKKPLPFDALGQGAGEAAAFAALDTLRPGAGRAAQGATAAVGNAVGSTAGAQGAEAAGQDPASPMSRLFSAILSGSLTAATAPGKAAAQGNIPNARYNADPNFVGPQQNDLRSHLPQYIDEVSRDGDGFLLNYLRDDDDVVSGTMKGLDSWIDSRFGTEQLSQSQTLRAFRSVLDRVSAQSGADMKTLQRIGVAQGDPMATTEGLFKASFGMSGDGPVDSGTMITAARTLNDYLRDDPELREAVMTTWMRQAVIKQALVPAKGAHSGLGMKGFVEVPAEGTTGKLAADSVNEFGPGGVVDLQTVRGDMDYLLDGEKFRQHILEMGPGLDTIFGKGSYKALQDAAEVMKLLDPTRKETTMRGKIANFMGSNLKYNANRMAFFTMQGAAGLGLGAISPLSLMAGFGLGVGSAAGVITLDHLLVQAVKNPTQMHYLRYGLENGKSDMVRAVVKNLFKQEDQQQPYREPGQELVTPLPTLGN